MAQGAEAPWARGLSSFFLFLILLSFGWARLCNLIAFSFAQYQVSWHPTAPVHSEVCPRHHRCLPNISYQPNNSRGRNVCLDSPFRGAAGKVIGAVKREVGAAASGERVAAIVNGLLSQL